jgi:hypothetical protein
MRSSKYICRIIDNGKKANPTRNEKKTSNTMKKKKKITYPPATDDAPPVPTVDESKIVT